MHALKIKTICTFKLHSTRMRSSYLFSIIVYCVWIAYWTPWIEHVHAHSKSSKVLSPDRLEWGLIGGPAFNVDTGVEIAAVMHMAQFRKGIQPYVWRLRALLKLAFRDTPQGIELPVHDYGLRFDLPSLLNNRLRIRAQAGFRMLVSQYYGMGNQSLGTRRWKSFDPVRDKSSYVRELRFYQYKHMYPYAQCTLQYTWTPKWSFFVRLGWQYNWIETFSYSQLRQDQYQLWTPGTSKAPKQIWGLHPHSTLEFHTGIVWDTRDNEFSPTSGWHHALSLRFSPGSILGGRYIWGGWNIDLRMYLPVWKKRLTLAMRLIGDGVFGQVPFYALTATGGLEGLRTFGGGSSLRGVRSARYHGNIKVLLNTELRWHIVHSILFRTFIAFEFVGYVDLGRVWMAPSHVTMRESRFSIHLGIGGGLRVRWGKSMIIRFDLAWSPDADPIGFYFNLGHLF